MPSTPRRLTGLLTAALLALVALTACGGSGPDADPQTSGAGRSGPAKGAFPVTVAHKYGSTTVESEPGRIVTVGLTDQDAVLALGEVPVGTTRWLGEYDGNVGPWARDELGGAEAPAVLTDDGSGPQAEKIAALRPDLILALYSGLTEEQYQTLSKIAPTVAQPGEYRDFGIPWQEQTRTVGKVLGASRKAESLVAGVEDLFAEAKKEHPEFASSTGLMATPYDGFFVFGSQDPRSRTLTSLGFALPADLDDFIGDEFGANISRERADLLDQDALVWMVGDPDEDRDKLRGDPVYGRLAVTEQGRDVYVEESGDYGNALSFVSVLSLPYALERLVPQLADAVNGKA